MEFDWDGVRAYGTPIVRGAATISMRPSGSWVEGVPITVGKNGTIRRIKVVPHKAKPDKVQTITISLMDEGHAVQAEQARLKRKDPMYESTSWRSYALFNVQKWVTLGDHDLYVRVQQETPKVEDFSVVCWLS